MFRRTGRQTGATRWLGAWVMAGALCGWASVGWLAGGWLVGGWAADASAGETLAMKYYGRGVHAYHDGRYFEALQNLDRATAHETRDPRIYYFRGLAKQRLGYDASADFQMAAQLEVALGRRDVGRALARVQGSDRLAVEQYRAEARKLPPEMVQSLIPPPAQPAVIVRSVPRVGPATPGRPSEAVRRVVAIEPLGTDDTDPFREGAAEFLGAGKPVAPQAVSGDALSRSNPASADGTGGVAADDGFGDEPFGSGVDPERTGDDADRMPDPFGDDMAAEPDAFAAQPDASSSGSGNGSGEGKPSALGAVFRAFTRGLTPSVPSGGQQLVDGLRGRVSGEGSGGDAGPGDPFQDDPAFDDAEFGDPNFEDTDSDDADAGFDAFDAEMEPAAGDATRSDQFDVDDDDPFADDPFSDQ